MATIRGTNAKNKLKGKFVSFGHLDIIYRCCIVMGSFGNQMTKE